MCKLCVFILSIVLFCGELCCCFTQYCVSNVYVPTGLRKALADLPCRWKLAGGLELCCDQWWFLHNPCGPRPAVLPDLNAGSGASKHWKAVLVEVLGECEGGGGVNCVCIINVYMCKWRFWRLGRGKEEGEGGGGGGGVRKSSLVELVCGKRGNCWSEGTGQ